MSPRDEFAAALAARNALTPDVLRERLAPVEHEYELKIWRLWRETNGKKPFARDRCEKWLAKTGLLSGLQEQYREKGRPAINAFRVEQARWDAELARIAPLVPLAHDARKPTRYLSRTAAEYHTQGGGADTYARVWCELTVFTLDSVGVHAGCSRAFDRDDSGQWAWEVWVPHDPFDVEVIKRLEHKVPQRELVRFCWKHGANPRVYWPLLPPGFEESNGLDYFGNDSRA